MIENPEYSDAYLDPQKRSIANAVQVFFADDSCTPRIELHYPLGHRRRRDEGMPSLKRKFESNLATRLPKTQCRQMIDLFENADRLESMPARAFMDLFQNPTP